jgi:hypothetical protein
LEAVELKKTESKIRVINLAYSQDLLYVWKVKVLGFKI